MPRFLHFLPEKSGKSLLYIERPFFKSDPVATREALDPMAEKAFLPESIPG
jgi:hypothetical protein